MKITIETIEHSQQPYPTVGDWRFKDDGSLSIKVSKMSDWRHEMLVAIHELVESALCEQAGITTEAVDAFDIEYEKRRSKALVLSLREPGDDPSAPYFRQHFIATNIERQMADAFGVNWTEYEKEVNSL